MKDSVHTKSRFAGFTLLELLIAVTIVGILAAVAYPAYEEHVRKSKRAEGKSALLKAAQLQERFYTAGQPGTSGTAASYANTDALPTLFGLATGTAVYSGEDPASAAGNYILSVDAPAGNCQLDSCFVLRAVPNPAANFADPECGALTLTSTGLRNRTGPAALNRCW